MREGELRGIRLAVTVLATLAALEVLGHARAFAVPVAFALFIAMCLDPVVSRLAGWHVPRPLAAALVLVLFTALVLVGLLSLQDDVDGVLRDLPRSALHLRDMIRSASNDKSSWWQRLNLIARNVGATRGTPATPIPVVSADGAVSNVLIQGSIGVATLVSECAMVLFLVYFLLIMQWGRLRVGARSQVDIVHLAAEQVQRFVLLLTFTNALLGALIWAAFAQLGVSHAAVWGVVAALLHVIPYAGPALFAIAVALAATVQFESFSHGLLVAAVAVVLTTLIGIVLTSWLSGKASRMNKAAVFVGLLFWAWLWGIAGLFLGVPMMMVLKVVADNLPALHWLSRLLTDEHESDTAARAARVGGR